MNNKDWPYRKILICSAISVVSLGLCTFLYNVGTSIFQGSASFPQQMMGSTTVEAMDVGNIAYMELTGLHLSNENETFLDPDAYAYPQMTDSPSTVKIERVESSTFRRSYILYLDKDKIYSNLVAKKRIPTFARYLVKEIRIE